MIYIVEENFYFLKSFFYHITIILKILVLNINVKRKLLEIYHMFPSILGF